MPVNYIRKTKDIFISDKLRSLLEEFKDDSKVAQILLYRRIDNNLLKEDNINYISISDSDTTKISYLTNDRIKKVEESSKNDYWTTSIRFHCKPGAFVGKIFKDIDSKEVEKFSNLYRAFSNKKEFLFEIVKGDDIAYYYNQNTYQNQNGSLGASCMKYNKCERYFDLYTKNESVKMLIMKSPSGDSILGRALLWNFECDSNEIKVMDRIYTIQDDEYQIFFKKWAHKNGYIYKTQQNWSNTLEFDKNFSKNEYKLAIKLNLKDIDKYPYLDTFKWLDLKSETLFNYKPEYFINDIDNFRLLSSADGDFLRIEHLRFDNINRNWDYSNNLVCYDGENYTQFDNCNYSETLDSFLLKSESEYNLELLDYFYKDLSKADPNLIEKRKNFLNKKLKYKI
jgi:hypothetical protein